MPLGRACVAPWDGIRHRYLAYIGKLRTYSTFGKFVCNKEEKESILEPLSIYLRDSKTSKESFSFVVRFRVNMTQMKTP